MGFPEIRCKKALINTGNHGADVAMNWLFEHMEDPGKKRLVLKRNRRQLKERSTIQITLFLFFLYWIFYVICE